MRFVNTTDHSLSFELAGTHYDVPVGGSIDVPDRYAFAVALHGLPLVEAPPPPPAPEPKKKNGPNSSPAV